ncbi:MAG: asparagine synthase B [Acidobacteriota bacterium]
MCGIFAILDSRKARQDSRTLALQQARLLRHRGPDWSGLVADEGCVLVHERLAIVDPFSGEQPLRDGSRLLAVNGEIYNHQQLRAELADHDFATGSDCEVILPLYRRDGRRLVEHLQGMYAFVLVDRESGEFLVARDPIGIIPLYYGRDGDGALYLASEMKALAGVCTSLRVFPPGHTLTSGDEQPQPFFQRDWQDYAFFESAPEDSREADPAALHRALATSVRSHLMSDVPYGVLLSGGLDSSVVAALAASFSARRVESDDRQEAWWPRLHSFAIGLEESPDLAAAQKVADAIGTVHHGFTYTLQEGLDALRDVVWHLETFDVTTIRASTPMFLLARRIKAMGVKMVLSGEGADEIFGGYLYFHKAPNPRAFHEETVRKLEQLHLYDCLRANKSMAAWGVEARVPFLDRDFLDHAMRIHPRHKMCSEGRMEKHILRAAFDGALPDEVLWRQKEQFSDGVGYGWIDALKAHAEERVSDRQLKEAPDRFPIGPPKSKEAYLYRTLFDEHYPQPTAAATVPVQESVACSTQTALEWDSSFRGQADPSGRAVAGVHQSAYRQNS